MDEDVAHLLAEQRISDAAALASARGDARTASELFERACDWHPAATEALRAGDPARAMRLAVLSGDTSLTEGALAVLCSHGAHDGAAEKVAITLEAHGAHAWAARIFESLEGHAAEAARAWERAGNSIRAAELLESMHDVIGAARLLEAAARRDPSHLPTFVALGALLLRYGKAQAAARALQTVPGGSPERIHALPLLIRALEQLGLERAAEEARRELSTLGPAKPIAEDPAPAAPTFDTVKGHVYGYEVVREIASTASSRVLQCIDGVRGGHVALKIYAGHAARGAGRDVMARFERELRALASLDHPNVVPLLDYFPDGPALVLSWMPGGTLETMLEQGAIAPARAVEIACAILGALGEAHRLGVLHRDVKPSNVLFDAAGAARLADFGTAHLGDLSATATAGIIGTFSYMSPEQRNGEPATIASDIYGVGVLLLEMLSGARGLELPPSQVHPELTARHDAVVRSLSAQDPLARPSDAFTARHALMGLRWPRTVHAAPRITRIAPAAIPTAGRVRAGEGGAPDMDTWLERPIVRAKLEPESLARASAFARADHRSLQTVLRVDRAAGEIWLEAPQGAPLARRLTESERTELRAALSAIHAAGIVHGAVDPAHVRMAKSGNVILDFTSTCTKDASAHRDHVALSRL